jgi:transcriptional regulator with PAS, ATPase and Fis domain
VVTTEPLLKPEHLPKKYRSGTDEKGEQISGTPRSLREEVEKFESAVIKRVLAQTRNYEKAAHLLGISLSTLTRRIRNGNIDRQN